MQSFIVVAGGKVSDNEHLASCEQFNVELDQWTSIAALNKPRASAAAAANSNLVFVFGGFNNRKRYLDEIEEYNRAANKWTILKARLTVARELIAAACLDDKIYLFGGYNYGNVEEANQATECFQVTMKTLKKCIPLVTPTYGSVATSLVITDQKVRITNFFTVI